MDKNNGKEQKIAKLIEIMRAKGISQADDKDLPPKIRELLLNAQSTGAKVVALSSDEINSLGIDKELLRDIIDDGYSLEVSEGRDLNNPRYLIRNVFAKEAASREFELMRMLRGTVTPSEADAIRLHALMLGNIDKILEVSKHSELGNAERPVLATLSILKTLDVHNIFDALSAGDDRLRWQGMRPEAIYIVQQIYTNIVNSLSAKMSISNHTVRAVTDNMAQPIGLSTLPPEQVFDEDFSSVFMRNVFPAYNDALDELQAAGFTKLSDIFEKTKGLSQLQAMTGMSDESIVKLATIFETIDSISIEAGDAVLTMIDESEDEADRSEQANIQPVIPISHPTVVAALGQNVVTTLEIAGVIDLHEVTGLRPTEAGESIQPHLPKQMMERIRDLCRFLNVGCECEACGKFREHYVKTNPEFAEALKKHRVG